MNKKLGFKTLALVLVLLVGVFALVACDGGDDTEPEVVNQPDTEITPDTEPEPEPTPEPELFSGAIAVVSREEGSGSRDAFEELVEFNQEEDGSDAMTTAAIIATGNGGVATTVVENATAIGYISLTTLLQHDLVGLYIDGVAPTAENMLSGAYTLTRPFNFVYLPDEIGDIERAFIEFAQSIEGLDVLEARGVVVDREGAQAFDASAHSGLSGSILFGGSTSTEATATDLAEEFRALFPGVDIQYSATGSGAGISGAADGTYAIGFASRAIRDTELETGIEVVRYSVDGLVVAVNPASGITGLTFAQLRAIYVGEITDWSEVQ